MGSRPGGPPLPGWRARLLGATGRRRLCPAALPGGAGLRRRRRRPGPVDVGADAFGPGLPSRTAQQTRLAPPAPGVRSRPLGAGAADDRAGAGRRSVAGDLRRIPRRRRRRDLLDPRRSHPGDDDAGPSACPCLRLEVPRLCRRHRDRGRARRLAAGALRVRRRNRRPLGSTLVVMAVLDLAQTAIFWTLPPVGVASPGHGVDSARRGWPVAAPGRARGRLRRRVWGNQSLPVALPDRCPTTLRPHRRRPRWQ